MGTPPNPTAAATPQPSQIQSAPALVGFDPKAAVPQQPIYLQRNDLLGFVLQTNGSGVQVRLNYRFLTPQGEIKEGQFITAPFTLNTFFELPLYEGWLLSFCMIQLGASVAGQWVFGQAVIARATILGPTAPIFALFWQGYINVATQAGWPGTPPKEAWDGPGTLRSITGTVPALGADISETVPNGRRWILLAIRALLTTSATVINRSPIFRIDDGANTFFGGNSYTNQAASLTLSYSGFPNQPPAAQTGGDQMTLLPLGIMLKSGCRIRTATANLQVGDQWTAPQYLVAEWLFWDT